MTVSQRLRQISSDILQVSDGSLYPALHKLEQQGWITAEWKPSGNNRRAKCYCLTRLGRRHLEKEAASWNRLSVPPASIRLACCAVDYDVSPRHPRAFSPAFAIMALTVTAPCVLPAWRELRNILAALAVEASTSLAMFLCRIYSAS
jgi:DNA-binding MarR family transcriptional regulator